MRMFLIVLSLIYVAGVGTARNFFIGPDHCAAPADYEAVAGTVPVEADDLNEWRAAADDGLAAIEVETGSLRDGERRSVWFTADPETGAVFTPLESDCR